MLRTIILGLLLAITAAPESRGDPSVVERRLEQARVAWVHDGDTITVSLSGQTEKVRLVGIDTPEVNDDRPEYRSAAYAARDYARARLNGKTVTLERDKYQPDRDDYGRLLRYVYLDDGSNLNDELVRKGYARVYDRFRFEAKGRLKALETEAKRNRLGVWTLPPGKWRSTSTF